MKTSKAKPRRPAAALTIQAMSIETPFLPFGSGQSPCRLFCLPFAGGGASNFMPWRRALSGIAIAPVQYPGHETRINEACATQVSTLVDQIARALAPLIGPGCVPYGLLGYSLGARLAYLLAQRVQTLGLTAPRALHVVANRPPDALPARLGISQLSPQAFRDHVLAYGGTPEEVFDTPELAELLLPILRADFALAEQTVSTAQLDIPFFTYAGVDDPVATPTDMQRWAQFTRQACVAHVFEGGHFFVRQSTNFLPTLAADVQGKGKSAYSLHD